LNGQQGVNILFLGGDLQQPIVVAAAAVAVVVVVVLLHDRANVDEDKIVVIRAAKRSSDLFSIFNKFRCAYYALSRF
jgi:hypothetical protein